MTTQDLKDYSKIPEIDEIVEKVSDQDFERLVKILFDRILNVKITKTSRWIVRRSLSKKDRGIDVQAELKETNFKGQTKQIPKHKVIIQCKKYDTTHQVPIEEVRSFIWVVDREKAERGYFVATSSFSETAYKEARTHGRVFLVDGVALRFALEKFYISRGFLKEKQLLTE